jgi:SpoVK/Ycf46/Vps4 family AAA+-type ATPase
VPDGIDLRDQLYFIQRDPTGHSESVTTIVANPLISFFTGRSMRRVVETVTPQRTLEDVVLPARTRRTLEQALAQVRNHTLIYRNWGLGERHTSGRGLTFNFAGPPGTGKTICAEAVANAVGMKLLVVDYAEAESMWVGETPKNIARIFRAAAEQDAVLFFDEADAIATRRSTGGALPHDREMNLTVNVLLHELEAFNGIVIFATNLAANFDPAFERRIRTHVLFEMPGPEDRERIWQLQIHPTKTPLASDVDFKELARRYSVSGGDIKNAVLKAASAAAAEPRPDADKRIGRQHFESAMEEVISAKTVMQQSLFTSAIEARVPIPAEKNSETVWNTPAIIAVVLASLALIASFVAIALVYLR